MTGKCQDLAIRPYELIDFDLRNKKVRFKL